MLGRFVGVESSYGTKGLPSTRTFGKAFTLFVFKGELLTFGWATGTEIALFSTDDLRTRGVGSLFVD